MIAYGDFKKRIKSRLWPYPGEHHSLVDAHDGFFQEAMGDLMKWIVCLEDNHTDVHPACSTYVECGKTVFDAPIGKIDRVYTIVNNDWCSKIFYNPASFDQIECWSRNLLSTFKNPLNAGLPALQQGYKYAEAASDSPFGRSRVGLYCIHRKRLYVVPWVQSNESVIVEWDGKKFYWLDTDMLDENVWTPDHDNAIKLFLRHHHDRDFEPSVDRQTLRDEWQEYLDARAMLIHSCQQRIEEKEAGIIYCCNDRLPTKAELDAEKATTTAPMTFAILGDFGINNRFEAAVAKVLKSYNPSFIVTTGDNWYGSGQTLSDIDLLIGQFYSDFIFPYNGIYGSTATQQMIFPVIGNHDRDPVGRLDVEKAYFSFLQNYYDLVFGPVHFFFLDSGYDNSQINREPDGNDVTSKQAQWLQAKLALSTAPFKIVLMHHPPFSSCKSAINVPPLAGDGTISFPALQWPFQAWGADAVIYGHCHNYERLLPPGSTIPYIVNGAGGAQGQIADRPAIFADVVLPSSVFRYNEDFGFQLCTVDCNTLTMKFINTSNQVIDTVVINKNDTHVAASSTAPSASGGSGPDSGMGEP